MEPEDKSTMPLRNVCDYLPVEVA